MNEESWTSCRHPLGCQAPGEGCVGKCPVTPEQAAEIEREYVAALDGRQADTEGSK